MRFSIGCSRPANYSVVTEPTSVARSTPAPVHCALFAPLHYEPNYAYPLLVWLHGPGSNETELSQLMPHVSLRNYTAVAPRGTVAANELSGFDWSDTPRQRSIAEARILQAVELATRKYNVSRRRIFVGGRESGGTAALRVALRNPELFAGVISIDGSFPRQDAPLTDWSAARSVPLLMITNRDSKHYDQATVCDDLRLWHTAGMKVMLRQYPNDAGTTDLMLQDVDRWMMERVTAGDSSFSDSMTTHSS